MQSSTEATPKHCIHMEPEIWQLARKTAKSLSLSTSQFISRLIEETDGAIQYKGLLEIPKHKAEG
ncbi:MAG: hypothetical protein ACK49N_08195 [Verrucomicrobiota bacterium]|jgi:hypothetical protein